MQIWITQLETVRYKILIKICFMGKIWKNVNLALPLFWGGNLILHNVSFAFCVISSCTAPCIKCWLPYPAAFSRTSIFSKSFAYQYLCCLGQFISQVLDNSPHLPHPWPITTHDRNIYRMERGWTWLSTACVRDQ